MLNICYFLSIIQKGKQLHAIFILLLDDLHHLSFLLAVVEAGLQTEEVFQAEQFKNLVPFKINPCRLFNFVLVLKLGKCALLYDFCFVDSVVAEEQ